MAFPQPQPQLQLQEPPRLPFSPRRWWTSLPRRLKVALAAFAAVAVVLSSTGFGYALGQAKRVVPVWDPLWIRSLLERPIDPSLPGDGFWVAGYWVGYDLESLRTLQARAPHLDQVIAFSYGFQPDGAPQGQDPKILLGVAHKSKLVLLFSNLTAGEFSADTAKALLTDASARRRSLDAMVGKAAEFGAAGIQLDFEGISPSLRDAYTSYVTDLAAALHARGKTLSIAVPAKTRDSRSSPWGGAFDYEALGRSADAIYIMAYDEHYRNGPPGPVASLPWTEKVIRYAISVMPTKKVILGIPGYGYDWGPDGGKAYGARTMAKRLDKPGARIQWDPVMGENVATYEGDSGPHTAWFPDDRSLQGKLDLAKKYNLKGVALWRLGFEPESYWEPMAALRQAREAN